MKNTRDLINPKLLANLETYDYEKEEELSTKPIEIHYTEKKVDDLGPVFFSNSGVKSA